MSWALGAIAIADTESTDGLAKFESFLQHGAAMETEAATQAEIRATAGALEKFDADSRALRAEVEAANARAAALEPGPARLIAHFFLLAVLASLLSLFVLQSSVSSWGVSSNLLPGCGVLVGVALFVAALYVLSKGALPQPERLRFAHALSRWLAPVRPSLLAILYALALLVAVALVGHPP